MSVITKGIVAAAVAAAAVVAIGGAAHLGSTIRDALNARARQHVLITPPPDHHAAWAYLTSHPAPSRKGLTAGMVLSVRTYRGFVTNLTVMVADGGEPWFVCDAPPRKGCTVPGVKNPGGLPGSYIYFRSGVIPWPWFSGIQVIKFRAVRSP